MFAAVMFVGSAAAGVLLLLACRPVLNSPALQRQNFAGLVIPTAAGFLFVPVYLLAYSLARLLGEGRSLPVFGYRESLLVIVIGMCFLGLLDDLAGYGEARGFKGHLSELFKGRLTTGMLKALGGFLVAVASAFPFSSRIWDLLLNAALISLCANLFNLLDRRPGRAIKAFIPAFLVVVGVTWDLRDAFLPYALSVAAVALVLMPGDLRQRYMIGDAGSNVLGATVGMGLAVGLPAWWRLGFLVFAAFLNAMSEKYSFSRIIAGNRVLRWIDRLGVKGDGGQEANT